VIAGYEGTTVAMEATTGVPTFAIAGRLHVLHRNHNSTQATIRYKIWMVRKWLE